MKKFTAEKTTAFYDIARTIFEASIERRELDLAEAFQLFMDMVLSLAVVPQEKEDLNATRPNGTNVAGKMHSPTRQVLGAGIHFESKIKVMHPWFHIFP